MLSLFVCLSIYLSLLNRSLKIKLACFFVTMTENAACLKYSNYCQVFDENVNINKYTLQIDFFYVRGYYSIYPQP